MSFEEYEVVAGQVAPLDSTERRCGGACDHDSIEKMLRSRERTMRFAGCRLARQARNSKLISTIRELAGDPEEDPYVRMEARTYLCEVAGDSADAHFHPILFDDADDQMRLEAAMALAETQTASAFELLRAVLEDQRQPLFLRSACAWGVGCHGTEQAAECLVRAFADVAPQIREEALVALEELGSAGFSPLLKGLANESSEVAAGAAEALRRIADVPAKEIAALAKRPHGRRGPCGRSRICPGTPLRRISLRCKVNDPMSTTPPPSCGPS